MNGIPNGRKELDPKTARRQVEYIKSTIDHLASVVYAPHNTPEDDEEMERTVYEYAAKVFDHYKKKTRDQRLALMLLGALKDSAELKFEKEEKDE